jgi:hypothetical protein
MNEKNIATLFAHFCRDVESNAKSNHAAHPFADTELVRNLIRKIGYTPVVDGVSIMREIDIGGDFLRVGFVSQSQYADDGVGRR